MINYKYAIVCTIIIDILPQKCIILNASVMCMKFLNLSTKYYLWADYL